MVQSNKIIKKLYDNSPYLVKALITSGYGLNQRLKRYGSIYNDFIIFLNETQYWEEDKLRGYQYEKLQKFYKEVSHTVEFYNNNSEYTSLQDIQADFNTIPILSKYTIKHNLTDFYNTKLKRLTWESTSGTTGTPLYFPISIDAFQIEYAFRHMHYNWAGISLQNRDRVIFCAGHLVAPFKRKEPPFWTFDIFNNHMYFSSYHLSDSNLKYYIKEMEKFNPVLLHGYPSSILLLAIAYKKYGSKRLNLKAIITASETLLESQRRRIEEIFQIKVFNWYGTGERSANIVECERGELHLKQEHSYIEILNEHDEPCKEGETGRIVSTNFHNIAFPLIRYDVGDTVTIAKNQKSKCGKSGLLIESIDGRRVDGIHTPDGRIVSHFTQVVKYSDKIREAQFEQHSVDELTIRVVKEKGFSKKDEEIILESARPRLGSDLKITFDYVDEIERSANGKFRHIISHIPSPHTSDKMELE